MQDKERVKRPIRINSINLAAIPRRQGIGLQYYFISSAEEQLNLTPIIYTLCI